MDIFISIVIVIALAVITFAIYRGVKLGNRAHRSINDYLKS